MISLTDDEQTTLKTIIKNKATDQPYRVVIFGSRATGKARKYSDIDLALIAEQAIPWKTIAALAGEFDDSRLPYTVDVVDFARAAADLQEQIKQQGVELMRT